MLRLNLKRFRMMGDEPILIWLRSEGSACLPDSFVFSQLRKRESRTNDTRPHPESECDDQEAPVPAREPQADIAPYSFYALYGNVRRQESQAQDRQETKVSPRSPIGVDDSLIGIVGGGEI